MGKVEAVFQDGRDEPELYYSLGVDVDAVIDFLRGFAVWLSNRMIDCCFLKGLHYPHFVDHAAL